MTMNETNSTNEFYDSLGKPTITRIVVTHGHMDHIGGLDRVQDAMQAPVGCHPKLAKKLSMMVGETNVVKLRSREMLHTGGGTKIRALFTPGHAEDHVCFYVAAERVLFTGDTILGASSSTVEKLDDYIYKTLELEIPCNPEESNNLCYLLESIPIDSDSEYNPLADLNEDGYITADELGLFLKEKVTIDSENHQRTGYILHKTSYR